MKQHSIILAFTILFFSCEDKLDLAEETFLEINSGIMWQSTDQYYQNTYLGFSNNKAEVLVYEINVDSDYGYCETYKEGENMLQSSECEGELGDSTVFYTIITNIENLLELDVSYYDKSCPASFSYSYQKSYSVDGDYVYETIESEDSESEFNEYSKTNSTYNQLCK